MAEKTKDKKITKNTVIADAVEINPDAPQIMFKYGLHCVGCHIALWETIEQGCTAHGLSEEDVEKMVEELNEKGASEA